MLISIVFFALRSIVLDFVILLLYKLLLIFLKTVLFGTVFYFALRSVVFYFIIIFINQVAYKNKFIPLVFQAFKYCGQCLGGVVGVIVEKDNTAVFYLTCHPFTNAVGGGIFFPVETVNIRYKSNILYCLTFEIFVI